MNAMSSTPQWLAVQLKLVGKRCVVIGGGRVATRKVGHVLPTGAHITVVSPEMTTQLCAWEQAGCITLVRRPFEPPDVQDADVLFLATNDPTIHHIARTHAPIGAWVNIADDPQNSDFLSMAVIERGNFQVAIGTGGQFPALGVAIKKQLDAQFPAAFAEYIAFLGQGRTQVLHAGIEEPAKQALLRRLLDPSLRASILAGEYACAQQQWEQVFNAAVRERSSEP